MKYFITVSIVGYLALLTVIETKELTDHYYGVYDYCVSNSKNYQVDKITSEAVNQVNFCCDTQLCAPDSSVYNITCNGKTILTSVDFPIARIILQKGTLIYLNLGQVKSGFWPGAVFTEVTREPNPHPEKCYTKTGVTKLVSDVSVLTIQKGHDKITCWGMYIDKYNPGINEN